MAPVSAVNISFMHCSDLHLCVINRFHWHNCNSKEKVKMSKRGLIQKSFHNKEGNYIIICIKQLYPRNLRKKWIKVENGRFCPPHPPVTKIRFLADTFFNH